MVDTQAEKGAQTPQDLCALIEAKVISTVELKEVQVQLQEVEQRVTLWDNLQLMERLPKSGVDISKEHDWQNMPQPNHFMFSEGRWATIAAVVPTQSEVPDVALIGCGNTINARRIYDASVFANWVFVQKLPAALLKDAGIAVTSSKLEIVLPRDLDVNKPTVYKVTYVLRNGLLGGDADRKAESPN
ncbi:MAG: hypothetical protein AAB606_05620 [Patescibacteria group bacterium]